MENSAFLDASSASNTNDQSGNSAFLDAGNVSAQTSSQTPSFSGNTAFNDIVPNDINEAKKYLGSQDYNGWCEMWQEKMTGSPNMGGSAYEAWNNYAQQGRAFQGLQGAQPGDKIYFSGDGGLGHTGIITNVDPQTGDATFISATDNGVKEYPVSQWLQSTGENLLGFAK